MEPGPIDAWAAHRRLPLPPEKKEMFLRYAQLIHRENRRFNLTGCKTIDEIIHSLIIGSIDPILGLEVPCGTRFVDVGSGAGIPGIPLGIFCEGVRGLLVESQRKKAAFIERCIEDLHLNTLSVRCGRVEDVARTKEFRESFDFAFSRGYAGLYVVLETALALVREGGLLFVYSNEHGSMIHPRLLQHAHDLGALIEEDPSSHREEIHPGIRIRKLTPTPMVFPRRYAVIKREARRLNGEGAGDLK